MCELAHGSAVATSNQINMVDWPQGCFVNENGFYFNGAKGLGAEQWSQDNDIKIRQSKPYWYAKVVKINNLALSDFAKKPSDSLATLSNSIRLH